MRFRWAVLFFAVLAAVMTWPQVAYLGTRALDHQDIFFNMWRFGWFAHALATAPRQLLNGNIFFPEAGTMTYSDMMPVECLLAAPMLWAGVPPVLVHNLMMLAPIVLSGAGAYVLARRLTGSAPAGITAGIVFAFAPYRFEHYMHMELQWTVWIPWAFWALHRTFETGKWPFGVLTGLCVALQLLSSVYYGVFLATLLGASAVLMLAGERRRFFAVATGLVLGGVLAIGVSVVYARPYLSTKQEVGGRSETEVFAFSARPSSYLVATPGNLLYGGNAARRARPERRLFPGLLPCLLALFGLLAVPASRTVTVYVLALILAFELSLGLDGYSYRYLYNHISVFEGLRAPARLGIFVVFFLGVLAAFGQAAAEAALPPSFKRVFAVLVPTVLLLEYWVAPLPLIAYQNSSPPLYSWLAQQPRGLVLELPVPQPDTLPGDDARYIYMSTFHWMPLANGYSGFYPASYLARIGALRHFPDAGSIARLRRDGVQYVVVHESSYPPGEAERVLSFLKQSPEFAPLGNYHDGRGNAALFVLR